MKAIIGGREHDTEHAERQSTNSRPDFSAWNNFPE